MTRAIVIGGGIAGMCSAKVLADYFDEVVLVERDQYPEGFEHRRGVPQSKMFHTLLERGRRDIEAIFPGFHKLLESRKLPKISFGFNCALMTPRGWGRNVPVPVQRSLFCTRGFLESAMRDLFTADPRTTLIEQATATGLLAQPHPHGKFCTGISYKIRGEDQTQELAGTLVVDASGASSRAHQWLNAIDVAPPREHQLDPLLTYGGQLFKLKPNARFPKQWWWTHGAFIQRVPPTDNAAAHLIRQEGDLWLLTMVAGDGHDMPKDRAGIEAFLHRMRSPLIYDMLPYFEPLGELTSYRLPKNCWKYYEDWAETLHGFLAIGASTCVFNPNQGQGMSVAAGDAGILRSCLAQTNAPEKLPKLFFKEQAKFQRNAYQLACSNDLKFASVQGPRTLSTRLFNWYRDAITRAGAADPWVARNVAEVDLLLQPISKIYQPQFLFRTLFACVFLGWRQRPSAVERVAPQPPGPAVIPRRLRVTIRNSLGTATRYVAFRLGLTR
ncbi:MAG: hypothetical protein GKR90_07830 [Pseudomonadales bacterium]|nr:hypothetical protein [Pseudomonadales bacterium]